MSIRDKFALCANLDETDKCRQEHHRAVSILQAANLFIDETFRVGYNTYLPKVFRYHFIMEETV